MIQWLINGSKLRYYEADKGVGSGDKTSDADGKKTDDQNKQKDGGSDNKNAGGENDDKGKETDKDKEKKKEDQKPDVKFTQADIDKAVNDRLDREKKKTEADDLKKKGEFETLYNTEKTSRETAESDLKTVTIERDDLAVIFNRNIDEQIKDWPVEVKALDPGSVSCKVRQDWVEKMVPIVKKLNTGINTSVNGEHGNQNNSGQPDPINAVMNRGFSGPKKAVTHS